MINTRNKTYIAFCVVLCLSSCATTDPNNSQIGATVGALLGAAVGAALDKNNRGRGALLGAGIGGGAGYMIGRGLDERDQAALKAKIEEAAQQDSTRPQIWQSDHSRASAMIMPAEAPRQVEMAKSISKEPDVAIEPSPLVFATGSRQATDDVNIRLGPGTHYAVKEVLRQGRVVNVIGMTGDGWYVIAEGNTAVGYVSGRYLQKPGERRASSLRPVPSPIETKPQVPQREAEQAPRQTNSIEDKVVIDATCRPVRVRVRTANGEVTENTVMTCQNPDGSWGG